MLIFQTSIALAKKLQASLHKFNLLSKTSNASPDNFFEAPL